MMNNPIYQEFLFKQCLLKFNTGSFYDNFLIIFYKIHKIFMNKDGVMR